jgi:hypothetical protein
MVEDRLPTPDPTVLTTEALLRAVAAERDYVDGQLAVLEQRFRGIDTATKLLSDNVGRVPSEVSKDIKCLEELITEKFASITLQFKERDTRSERESRDNKVAVDAAFAAQKEAASEQNKSNTLAITKSGIGTTETITKLTELFRTTMNALSDKVDDLKDRVRGIEAARNGYTEQRTEHRASVSTTTAVIGSVVGVIVLLVLLVGVYTSLHRPVSAPTVTVTVHTTTTP